jgi:hypothetical protein
MYEPVELGQRVNRATQQYNKALGPSASQSHLIRSGARFVFRDPLA